MNLNVDVTDLSSTVEAARHEAIGTLRLLMPFQVALSDFFPTIERALRYFEGA